MSETREETNASAPVSIGEQVTAVLSEVIILETLLPRLVMARKETQWRADLRLKRLRAALATLRELQQQASSRAATLG